jgi:hypothetical protein
MALVKQRPEFLQLSGVQHRSTSCFVPGLDEALTSLRLRIPTIRVIPAQDNDVAQAVFQMRLSFLGPEAVIPREYDCL